MNRSRQPTGCPWEEIIKAKKKKERDSFLEDLLAALSPEYLASIIEARTDYRSGKVKTRTPRCSEGDKRETVFCCFIYFGMYRGINVRQSSMGGYPVTNDFKDLVSRPFVALRLLSGGNKERIGGSLKAFPGI